MKIEELSIGDWIEVDGEFTDVIKINRTEISTACTKEIDIRKVNPIFLTPEILKNNEILPTGRCHEYQCSGKNFDILFTERDGIYHIHGSYVFNGKLKYVHELQHALRLCKIDKEIEL